MLSGTQEDGNDFKLSLIFKQAPSDETRRIGFNVEVCFNRECYMYETVLPVFAKLEEDFAIEEKLRYPALYGTSRLKGAETIILEDLIVEGYKMRNRKEPIDWPHSEIAIEYLAHLHSLSFVLKKRNPELFSSLSDLPETFFNRRFLQYYKDVRMPNAESRVAAIFDGETNQLYLDKVKYIHNNFIELFEECLSAAETNGYNVISHGDGWTNNIFYKYEVNLTF